MRELYYGDGSGLEGEIESESRTGNGWWWWGGGGGDGGLVGTVQE